MGKGITAAVTTVALGLLALAPAAAQAESQVSVSVGEFGVQVNGDASDNSIHLANLVDPQCPGGSTCREVDAGIAVIVASAPCVIPTGQASRALCPINVDEPGIGARGGGGNDSIVVSDSVGVGAKIGLLGGPGNDTVKGSLAEEAIFGDKGDDTIRAGRGDDVAHGDAGRDRILGSNGADLIRGGDGFDNLIGGLGGDHLLAGSGNDGMDGSQGHDVCTGGGGRDTARHCERVRSTP